LWLQRTIDQPCLMQCRQTSRCLLAEGQGDAEIAWRRGQWLVVLHRPDEIGAVIPGAVSAKGLECGMLEGSQFAQRAGKVGVAQRLAGNSRSQSGSDSCPAVA
jgi:hypothetical protein